jgi:hypothetical protein
MKKTALNTYLGDMIQGRIARIPSSSDDHGLEYIPIPIHQAQIGVVSSAGMTINANSMALVQNGTLFLQDGMSNASSNQYIDRKLMSLMFMVVNDVSNFNFLTPLFGI